MNTMRTLNQNYQDHYDRTRKKMPSVLVEFPTSKTLEQIYEFWKILESDDRKLKLRTWGFKTG